MTIRPQRHFSQAVALCLIAVLTGFVIQPSQAQSTESSRTTMPIVILDWDTAWQMARENNERHQLAIHEREKARFQVLEAWSYAMPTLDVNGTFNHYLLIPTMEVEFAGQTMEFQFSQDNTIAGNAQLTQPLWLAGKVGLGLRVAKNFRQIAELGVEVSEQDLRVQLVESFYGALVADEYVAVTQEALEQADRHLERVETMLEQGVVSEYDHVRARVAVANLKPTMLEAETARDLAYKALKNLIGMDLDEFIEIKGAISDVIHQPELKYSSATEFAIKKRIELQQLDLQKLLYKDQKLAEERSWLWPNILAGVRWETQAQSPIFNFSDEKFFNGVSAQLMINIPLFDGLASHRRSQIAEVNMRSVDLQKNMLERGIQLQVFQATRGFKLASEKFTAALENREEAEKGYRIAETRYESGVGTQLEVLDAQLQLNSSRVNVLQAQYDQLVAQAQYDRALGQTR